MTTPMTKEALADNAACIANILENIAGYESDDIDGDSVELRFEDEYGVDNGCDISIVEQCQRAADVIRSLLDELEAAEKRIAEQSMLLEGSDAILADYAETLSCAGDTDSILAAIVSLQSRAESAEQALLLERQKGAESSKKVVKLPMPYDINVAGERVDWNKGDHYDRDEVDTVLTAAGITLQIHGGE